ncbi:MAG: bifunctional metallophosphatase/5'-nucleotidase [Chlorobi bacterium]|nr:bifunctional metallophosphatase/5'-nucleotidase [Chlorobiota bacterium]
MSRRRFIRNISAGAVVIGAGVPLSMCKGAETEDLVILHTNDMHSQVDPFPKDHPKFPGMGGFARIGQKIADVKKNYRNVLVVDAGDVFQGSPYFNFFKGELDFKLMSKMGYDASTFGNHEFDNGMEELARQAGKASFPFLNCNYGLSNTPLKDIRKKYIILNKGNAKIGITGVGIDLKGLADPSNVVGLVYNDPVESVEKVAAHLKNEEKCDLVICLSHLGYRYKFDKVSDLILAANTKYVDVIIGGHTHTFMKQPDVIRNKHNKQVIVHQAGWGGLRLGALQIKVPLKKGMEPVLV